MQLDLDKRYFKEHALHCEDSHNQDDLGWCKLQITSHPPCLSKNPDKGIDEFLPMVWRCIDNHPLYKFLTSHRLVKSDVFKFSLMPMKSHDSLTLYCCFNLPYREFFWNSSAYALSFNILITSDETHENKGFCMFVKKLWHVSQTESVLMDVYNDPDAHRLTNQSIFWSNCKNLDMLSLIKYHAEPMGTKQAWLQWRSILSICVKLVEKILADVLNEAASNHCNSEGVFLK